MDGSKVDVAEPGVVDLSAPDVGGIDVNMEGLDVEARGLAVCESCVDLLGSNVLE